MLCLFLTRDEDASHFSKYFVVGFAVLVIVAGAYLQLQLQSVTNLAI